MADKQLRMRIGAAVSSGLDDQALDLIYHKLMDIEDAGKIPVTAKIVFSVDAEGMLEVEIDLKGNFPISKKKIRLSSDGKQLKLWDTPAGKKAAEAEEPGEGDELGVIGTRKKAEAEAKAKATNKKAREVVKKAAASKKKPVQRKVAGKKGAKKQRAVPKKNVAAQAVPKRKGPQKTAQQRMDEIEAGNVDLYRRGAITREQAEEAGVDVEAIDNMNGSATAEETRQAEDFGGEIGDLTADELAGLDDLV